MKQNFVIIFFLALCSGILTADSKPVTKPPTGTSTGDGFVKVATLACTNGNIPKGLTSISCKGKDAKLSCNGKDIQCSDKQPPIFSKGFDPKGKQLCGNKKEDQDDFVGCMVSLVPATCVNPGTKSS